MLVRACFRICSKSAANLGPASKVVASFLSCPNDDVPPSYRWKHTGSLAETRCRCVGFVPYSGEGYALLIPSKWNPSKERDFPGTELRSVSLYSSEPCAQSLNISHL